MSHVLQGALWSEASFLYNTSSLVLPPGPALTTLLRAGLPGLPPVGLPRRVSDTQKGPFVELTSYHSLPRR